MTLIGWATSLPALLLGGMALTAVRYWASLCTNRTLLGQVTKLYMLCMSLALVIGIWHLIVFFLTFKVVKRWDESVALAMIYPFYCWTIVLMIPYLIGLLYFLLEFWYMVDELEMGGNIIEPDPPAHYMDLSDVTLLQTCMCICAFPCVLCIQACDCVSAVWRSCTGEIYKIFIFLRSL